MMRFVLPMFVTVLAVHLTTSRAGAQVVYDNGSITGSNNARNISDFAIADDFAVSGNLQFNAIRFYALDTVPGLFSSFSGSLTWYIHSSSGTVPTAIPSTSILSSGTISGGNITVTNTGQILNGNPNFEVAQLDFSIPAQSLPTGSYWLRLKEGTASSTFDGSAIFWMQTGGPITNNGYRVDTNEVAPTTWNANPIPTNLDLSYQFLNVPIPEPGSLLMALPILACIGRAKYRRRS